MPWPMCPPPHHDPGDRSGHGILSVFSLMGLPFGMVTLVIAHTTFCVPYVFTMVRARLVGMDRSLEEAALDLRELRSGRYLGM